MDDTVNTSEVPAGWLEALARSDAQLAARLLVSGDDLIREAWEAIHRLERKQLDKARAS